ncbi:LysR substrate-binding domain-containing protein [Bradyrhizobium sp. CCGUVB1N3]|uniref:LysR substrate-binding domain-containing protein n=1 Tax=Bradyrhizobium sp. CCGUVB1N3 TaxID=2949629 RepID=UPI0020B3C745|nr:LysR substrate-binding domain-containing protein [Bradyrhizobium sp. CCGUVB1N3]MCP3473316.1 LysR substrate-binding domain-containing protein [Bradyrhizobium sp. CCGUVB1N3]
MPSTSYLLAFESAARHLSFTRTAMELNITQTAVSHRIKALEDFVGVRLFDRDTTFIRLTPWGHEYLETVRGALTAISGATSRLIDGQNENSLSITAHINFGLNYLIPLLPDFRKAFPKIALRVNTITSFDELERHDYDVAVRYGSGHWPGYVSCRLSHDECFPVCSPGLLKSGVVLTNPLDLNGAPIIRTASQILGDDWPQWLEAAEAKDVQLNDAIVCDRLFATVQAAVHGLGVAMGRASVVNNELATGALIEPFCIRLPLTTGAYITADVDKATRPVVQDFTNWLISRIGGHEPISPPPAV